MKDEVRDEYALWGDRRRIDDRRAPTLDLFRRHFDTHHALALTAEERADITQIVSLSTALAQRRRYSAYAPLWQWRAELMDRVSNLLVREMVLPERGKDYREALQFAQTYFSSRFDGVADALLEEPEALGAGPWKEPPERV